MGDSLRPEVVDTRKPLADEDLSQATAATIEDLRRAFRVEHVECPGCGGCATCLGCEPDGGCR